MRYYFARFGVYMIVVSSTHKKNALGRLIEYVRITKGNIGYSEEEIKDKAQIDTVDFIDDIGHLSKLMDIGNRINQLKREYENKLNNELGEVQKIKRKMRDLVNVVNDYENDYEDY